MTIVIVVAVSAAAIAIITTFSRSSSRTFHINTAISMVENVREAFLYAESTEEFEELLPVVSDSEFTKIGKVYAFDETGYSGYITAGYAEDGSGYFSANIRDANNNIVWELEEFSK